MLATCVIAYLVYYVLQTETDPGAVWGWMVMSAIVFFSASFLAYSVILQESSSYIDEKENEDNQDKPE